MHARRGDDQLHLQLHGREHELSTDIPDLVSNYMHVKDERISMLSHDDKFTFCM